MAGFRNDVMYAGNVDFSGGSPITGKVTANGQLLIGASVAPFIRVATLTSSGSTVTISNGAGTINLEAGASVPTTFNADSGSATPAANILTVAGGSNGIDTTGSGSTLTLNFDVTETGCITTVNGDSGSATASSNTITLAGSGSVTTSASGSTITITGGGGSSSIPSTPDYFEDFINYAVAGVGKYFSTLVTSTGAANIQTLVENGRPGVVELSTGTNAAGGISLHQISPSGDGPFLFGGGAATMSFWGKITTALSDGTETYMFRLGFGDSQAAPTVGTDYGDGIWMEYIHSANSGNWVMKTASASTVTTANSSTAADLNWHKFTITINAGATSVGFFIDDVELANSPITTNIPSVQIGSIFNIKKSAGTTARRVAVDLWTFNQTLTTPR